MDHARLLPWREMAAVFCVPSARIILGASSDIDRLGPLSDDPKALADALLMLAADPARAIELGLAGRTAVSKDFNREHDAAEFKNPYCEIFSQRANV
jgi:glycosyltransferase involved in cell wall biosynthesis